MKKMSYRKIILNFSSKKIKNELIFYKTVLFGSNIKLSYIFNLAVKNNI